MTIIEGYVIDSSLGERILIESDSFLVIRSLTSHDDNISELKSSS